MKISPIASAGTIGSVDTQDARDVSIRNIKMNVNRTPIMESVQAQQELSISDENKEVNPTAEATQPISPQFAALAKGRRALQQERRAFEDERREWQTKSQGSDQVPLSRLKSDPLTVLLENGVTYDQLAQAVQSNSFNPEVHALKNEINALKEGIDKRFTDKQEQEITNYLSQKRNEATHIVSQDQNFELIRATDNVDKAIEYMDVIYRKNGAILDVRQALEKVEGWLYKQQQKLASVEKIKGLYEPKAAPIQPQQPRQMTTLTNKHTASVPLSAKQRAIAAFYGAKK